MRAMPVLAAIFALTFTLTSGAQEEKINKKVEATLRTVKGTVFDNQDKPVVGAIVQLKDVRTLQMLSYVSKENGEYHFSSLKIDDDYEIEAKNNHMTSGQKRISVFDDRKIVIQNLKTDKQEKLEKPEKR